MDTTSLWTASLTDSAALIPSPDRAPLLKLFVGMDGGVYHVSVSGGSSSALDGSNGNATESTTTSATGTGAQTRAGADGVLNPIVEIVKSEPGPRPLLNRPVVLGPDGKNVDEPVEKTFIQKYVSSPVFQLLVADGSGIGGCCYLLPSLLCLVVQRVNRLFIECLSDGINNQYNGVSYQVELMARSLSRSHRPRTQIPIHHTPVCDSQ